MENSETGIGRVSTGNFQAGKRFGHDRSGSEFKMINSVFRSSVNTSAGFGLEK